MKMTKSHSSYSSRLAAFPMLVAVPLLSTSLSISTNWVVAARCLDWADFLLGMGDDDAGKMECFVCFFIGDVNGNVLMVVCEGM